MLLKIIILLLYNLFLLVFNLLNPYVLFNLPIALFESNLIK